jgi:putative transposase
MDFMADQLFDERPFRILTVVDCHTREARSIAPRVNFRACQVVEVLDDLTRVRGRPKSLRVDNGPEFALADAGPVGVPERGGVGLLQAR